MMRALVILVLSLLSGCATRPVWLENRIACTADGQQLHALSLWGPFSIGSQIREADAVVVCGRFIPN